MFRKILFVLFIVKNSYSVCNQSYMTFCDCVNDLEEQKTRNWTELVIGTTNFCQISIIKEDTFKNLEKIELLFIVNQVSDIYEKSFASVGHTLKYLKFYGNNLNNIKSLIFSGFMKLSKLSLINNNIETLEEYSFKGSKIETLDLSRNQIQSILQKTFDESTINRIIIKYNKLSFIHSKGFNNENLEVLNLDFNNIENLASGFLGNLPKLKELSLAHNQLSHLSGLSSLNEIKKLDFSFNRINLINIEDLEELKDLTYLNLNNNKLEMFSLKHLKKVRNERFTLLLSYNLLTNLQIEEKRPIITITLFGNPWNCNCLMKLEKRILDFNFQRTKCDLELFGTSNQPICLDQGECKTQPAGNRDDLGRFLEQVKKMNLKCDLFNEISGDNVVNANYTINL